MAAEKQSPRSLFPERWMKGIALSVYQNSSDTNSNWTEFIKRKNYLGQKKNIKAFQRANDFWTMYEHDIQLAKDMGATSFRFSFEWARFEPDEPGVVDPAAVARFHEILDVCDRLKLEPMVTLHHFTHPQWFEKMGGFTKAENEPYFVNYCCMVFREYGHRARLWTTFNEPTCFAFVGYLAGLWCPGEVGGLEKCGVVLLNLLKAHVSVYRAIKQLPGGPAARVGLVHQHIVFMPRDDWPWVRALCKWMTFWFASYSTLTFFKTGVFKWDSPVSSKGPRTLYADPGMQAGECVCDWWGINYYSRPAVHWNFTLGAGKAKERVSDIDFRIYPQGLYDSIKDASVLGLPIYITETGLADEKDVHRAYTVRGHYAAVLQAIADGYDVRGVYWWTLMDNIEWHEGFHIKFGLYRWDPEWAAAHEGTAGRPAHGLTLREGAKPLRDEIHALWPDTFSELRAYAAQNASTCRPSGMPPIDPNVPLQVPELGPPTTIHSPTSSPSAAKQPGWSGASNPLFADGAGSRNGPGQPAAGTAPGGVDQDSVRLVEK